NPRAGLTDGLADYSTQNPPRPPCVAGPRQ
ncbi:MAG: hypothetical protein AMXMBFR47_31240, partial [Planctomycetota bacterium]